MVKEALISVISPESKRKKLAPGEMPPGMGGPPGGLRLDPSKITMAKRLKSLDKKTVYLVDIGFGGGYNFMVEVQNWFKENMPSVKTIPRRKPGQVFGDDNNELWEEIKVKGDAVVLGVGG
jgi:hypothetical protein